MMKKSLIAVVILGLVIQSSKCFPSSAETSEDDDTQQQQQQNLNAESLEEFSTKIKTKGKVEKLVGETPSPTPTPQPDPCLEKKRVGRCKAAVRRIYFNKDTGKCQGFIYGGCGAGANNFKTLAECETVCAKHLRTISILPVPNEGDNKEVFTPPTISSSITTVKDPEVCNLPKTIGPCYAIKQRYYFDKKNNRCQQFVYGGCGENGNNFKTADECVRLCGGDTPSENVECSDVDCPWELYSHYTTLDCKPIYDGQACCPTRFDCPDKSQQQLNNTLGEARSLVTGEPATPTEVVPPTPHCEYKGKTYSIGEDVEEASDTGSCRAACFCSDNRAGKASIRCASIECAEHLGGYPDKRHCIPLYKKRSCCAHDFYCHNDTLIIEEPGEQQKPIEKPVFKCNIDGESFYEGQRFYPKKSKCLKCICGKGFNGTLSEEYCEPIDCGIEIYYSDYLARGCAPVYYQSADGSNSCCPISWECADEEVLSRPLPPSARPPPPPPTNETSGVGPVPVTPATESPLVVPTPSTVEVVIPPTSTDGATGRNRTHHLLLTQAACDFPKEIGKCKGQRPRYFYNKDTNACEQFFYSGCGKNDNNFVSVRDCQRLCITGESPSSLANESSTDNNNQVLGRSLNVNNRRPAQGPRTIYVTEVDPCTLPKKTGHCKGYFLRYFYSPEDNSCTKFVFGGCRSNGNNFYTKESCEATCTRSMNVQDLRTSIPSRSGGGGGSSQTESRGDASMVRFGEDSPTIGGRQGSQTTSPVQPTGDTNLTVIQGGDSDGENRVSSSSWRSSHSQSHYLERCHLPMKAGSCLGIVPSYYFDVETNTCNFFLWSGCFGNANRFGSLVECEDQCKPSTNPMPTPTTQDEEGIGGRMFGLPWRQDKTSPTIGSMVEESEDGAISGRGRSQPGKPDQTSMTLPTPEEAEEVCKLSSSQGPCRGHILRFHWDSTTQGCRPFVWGGCRGNRNNFVRESDCLSICGKEPTIEQLTSDGILSCTFGNESLPVGATVKRFKQNKRWNPNSTPEDQQIPCGVPICQCITPPSVTCFQTSCPTPAPPPTTTTLPTTTTEKVCPTPSCGANCKEAIGLDGCPTCDCDDTKSQVQIEEIFVPSGVKVG